MQFSVLKAVTGTMSGDGQPFSGKSILSSEVARVLHAECKSVTSDVSAVLMSVPAQDVAQVKYRRIIVQL